MQLLTRHFKQLYERVYITTIRYIFPTILIIGRIVQMYADLKNTSNYFIEFNEALSKQISKDQTTKRQHNVMDALKQNFK